MLAKQYPKGKVVSVYKSAHLIAQHDGAPILHPQEPLELLENNS